MESKIVQRLCHILGSTEESTRKMAFRSLNKLFSTKDDAFDPLIMKKITKAIYYAIWMTDGPTKLRVICVQAAQCHKIMKCPENRFAYFRSLFQSLSREWHLLDKNRLDKVLLFVRVLNAEIMYYLNQCKWDLDIIDNISGLILDEDGIFAKRSMGLSFQFLQTFVEEFENNRVELVDKNEFNEVSAISLLHLMKPFVFLAATSDSHQLLKILHLHIFRKLCLLDFLDTSAVFRVLYLTSKIPKIASVNRRSILRSVKLCGSGSSAAKALPEDTEEACKTIISEIKSSISQNDVSKSIEVSPESDPADRTDCFTFPSNFGRWVRTGRSERRLRNLSILKKIRRVLTNLDDKDENSKAFLKMLNEPKVRSQLVLSTLHSIRKLSPKRLFKFGGNISKIVDLSESNEIPPSTKRTINVAKAIYNIKNGVPSSPALCDSNKKKRNDGRKVMFNLRNNQVAFIPKKKRSTISPFDFPLLV